MSVEVKIASNSRDRRRCLAFVRRHVRRLYGGIPPPSEILLFVERNRRICGTISLDFVGRMGKFHLESIYSIDYAKTPWSFDRGEIAQFGKWWSTVPGLGVHLMQAAHLHALAQGKKLGLVEAKPRIVAMVEAFGVVLVEIQDAVLQIQGTSSRGEGYYATLPPPKLYMFDIFANSAAIERFMRSRSEQYLT